MSGAGRNQLRIIGGEWRGRKLAFAPLPGLRPTPDRVRETLFNWLRDSLPGARCLDLFAGSGALGFEALSRGAAEAVLVDNQAPVIAQLQRHIDTLRASGARAVLADALRFLEQTAARPFDIVFLDPPFSEPAALSACLERLTQPGWLADTAWVYVEADRRNPLPALAAGWAPFRHKEAGQVGYHLFRVTKQPVRQERTAT